MPFKPFVRKSPGGGFFIFLDLSCILHIFHFMTYTNTITNIKIISPIG